MTTSQPGLPGKSLELAKGLEEEILRAGLRPGWRLPAEAQLAETHGVSRTVVREAIQHLKARGLATSRKGGGTYVAAADPACVTRALRTVARLSESPASDADDLHREIAAAAAATTAKHRSKPGIARLRKSLAALRQAQSAEESGAALAALYRAMGEESGNPLYTAILAAHDRPPPLDTPTSRRWESIIDAIAQGKASEAAELIRDDSEKRPPAKPK